MWSIRPRSVGHEIGQRKIALAGGFFYLLTKAVKTRHRNGRRGIRVKLDILADPICRPKTEHAPRAEAPVSHDVIEKSPRVVVELACLDADNRVVEDRREMTRSSHVWKNGDQSK